MTDIRNISKYSREASKIEEDIVGLISKINVLCLMSEGISKTDDRAGMAVEEVGCQLDRQARSLLERWEVLSLSLAESSGVENVANDISAPAKPKCVVSKDNVMKHPA